MNARHVLLLLAAGCGGATAQSVARNSSPAAARADIAPVRTDLSVYADGKGHYLALVEPDPMKQTPRDLTLFYGDGKQFYAAPVVRATADGLKFEIGFNDARIPAVPAGSVKRELGKVTLACYGTEVPLEKLPAPEAQAMVGAATFWKNSTRWSPVALVKDGDRYLYVDHGAQEDNRAQYRVFQGEKGAMRPIGVKEAKYDDRDNKLTIVTDDGALVATRDDTIKTGYALGLAWEGKGKPAGDTLERAESWHLIFEGLGVYPPGSAGRSPTPCDPMMP